MFNVMDYGAAGNGTTDDTVAINRAITAAAAVAPAVVYAPGGLYLISSALVIPAGVMLVGDGRGITIIWQNTLPAYGSVTNSPNASDVVTVGGSNVIVRNLTIRGGAGLAPGLPTPGGGANGQHGLNINTGQAVLISNILVEGVTVEQCQTNCLQVWDYCQDVRFRDVRLTDAGNEGCYIGAIQTGYISFSGLYIYQCQSFGFDTNAGRVKLSNFVIRNCGNATLTNYGGGVSVYLSITGFSTTFMDSVIVENGEIHDCIGYGGVVLTVPQGVGEIAQDLVFASITATSTNNSAVSSGFSVVNVAGANKGTVSHVSVSDVKLSNLNFNTQSCTDIKFRGCDTENTLSLPAVDEAATQGFRLDDSSSFGPVTLIACTAKGWRTNFWCQSGTRIVGVGCYAINAVTYGFVLVSGTGFLGLTFLGCKSLGSGTNGWSNNCESISVILGSEGNNADGLNTVVDMNLYQTWSVPVPATQASVTAGVNAAFNSIFEDTLAANQTVGAPTGARVGQRVTFTFIQNGTGGYTVTWNSAFKVSWSDTGNTANKRSSISFIYDGTNFNQDGAQTPYV